MKSYNLLSKTLECDRCSCDYPVEWLTRVKCDQFGTSGMYCSKCSILVVRSQRKLKIQAMLQSKDRGDRAIPDVSVAMMRGFIELNPADREQTKMVRLCLRRNFKPKGKENREEYALSFPRGKYRQVNYLKWFNKKRIQVKMDCVILLCLRLDIIQ